MNKSELITKQQLEIEELKDQVKDNLAARAKVHGMIYCIGGPLNDNNERYTNKQRFIFHRISAVLALL